MITLENILNAEPQRVSKNFYDYTNLIYGESKIGKSTLNTELYRDRGFFIFAEPRFRHLEGIKSEYVTSWSEFLQIISVFLKNKNQLLDVYPHIIISGVENLLKYCKVYTLSHFGVEELNDVAYGQAHSYFFDQWSKFITILSNNGYKVHYELHSTINTVKIPIKGILPSNLKELDVKTDKKTGDRYVEYEKTVPDMKSKFLNPILNIVDNILYLSITQDENEEEKRCIHLRETMYWKAGITFRGEVPETIELNANILKDTFEKAINNYELTEEKEIIDAKPSFEEVLQEVGEIGKRLCGEGKRDELTKVIEKYLGEGAKVSEASEEQEEEVNLILMELKEIE